MLLTSLKAFWNWSNNIGRYRTALAKNQGWAILLQKIHHKGSHLFRWRARSSVIGYILFFVLACSSESIEHSPEPAMVTSKESARLSISKAAQFANPKDTATVAVGEPKIPGLPSPLRITDYEPKSTYFSEEGDLKLIGEVFNAVLVPEWYVREQQWEPIQKVIDAGLIPVIRYDKTKYLFRGDTVEVQRATDKVIAGLKAAPFPLKFIKLADEFNYGRAEKEELQTIDAMVVYLNMTARRFKEAGLFTLVDATSPELFNRPTDRETFTIAGLNAIIATGLIDGILMGNPGHRQGEEAVVAQWKNARKLWPNVVFFSRSASFSFSESTFQESGKNAEDLIRWAIHLPDSLGSAGWHLWAWRRQDRDGTVWHLLNANGESNKAWDSLVKMVNLSR